MLVNATTIQDYRCKKMNLDYYYKEIDNIEKLNALVDNYIALHSSRIGRVYISLLNKGVSIPLVDVFDYFNSREIVKLRSFRTTLHKSTVSLSRIIHKSTLKRKTSANFRSLSSQEHKKINSLVYNLFKTKKYFSQSELEKSLSTTLTLGQTNVKKLIYDLWNSGYLAVHNISQNINKEKRIFSLFEEYYGYDINDLDLSEQDCINYIVHKYIKSFGPVTLNDIAWWSGFSKKEIELAISDITSEIVEISCKNIENKLLVYNNEIESLLNCNNAIKNVHYARFMSFEDSSIKAYYETRRLFGDDYRNYFNKIGEVYSTILVDGKIVGRWSFQNSRLKLMISDDKLECYDAIEMERIVMEEKLKQVTNLRVIN